MATRARSKVFHLHYARSREHDTRKRDKIEPLVRCFLETVTRSLSCQSGWTPSSLSERVTERPLIGRAAQASSGCTLTAVP